MPEWKETIRKRLKSLNLEPTREAEIVEELSQHLDDRYRELLSRGIAGPEARRVVLAELSERESLAGELRRVERRVKQEPVVLGARRRNLMRDLWQDLRYSVRTMLKQPGFTATAVLTLALGIGPITAVFTLAHAVLLKPLPYKEPERLVIVWKNTGNPSSVPDFVDWRDQNQVCEEIGALSTTTFNLLGEGEPEAFPAAIVSSGVLSTFGVAPMLGRWFLPNEDQPGGPRVVALSHALWQQRFGADADIIGKMLRFNAQPYEVVAVMPPGFEFPSGVRLWATAPVDANNPSTPRGSNFLDIVARLKPGVSIEQARTDLQTVLQPQYPTEIQLNVVPLHEQLVGNTRTPLLLLLGAIAFVLLIACANVANLLLVRAATRQKEVAVRTALGASQSRLFRQLLTESVLLTAIGGAVGLLLAFLSLDLLVSLSPMRIPRLAEVSIDGRVLGFLSSIVLLTGVVFGTLSAFRLSEGDLRDALKEGTGRATSGRTRQRLRSGLVVTEIGLSLVLLIGTGLMLRSFFNLLAVDPGFRPEGVLSISLSVPQSRYPERSQRAAFIQQVIDRLQAIPQARSVASTAYIPLSGLYTNRRFAIEGLPLPGPGREPFANNTPVSPEYFGTLDMPVVAGRHFTVQDDIQAPGVAIVNQTFVRRYFAGEEVIGKNIRFYSSRDPQPPWLQIVGVAGDIRQVSLGAEAQPEIYVPHAQSAWPFMNFFVRADGDPMGLTAAIRSAIKEIDKDQPISKIATLDEVLEGSIADRRGLMFLLAVFAAVALVLAAVGIYGVISNSVSQRTREIGIRMALGAQTPEVLKLIMRQGVWLVVIGTGLGLVVALLVTRLMSDQLFEVSPRDLITFVGVPLILGAVALAACYIPARRAMRVDPIAALRDE